MGQKRGLRIINIAPEQNRLIIFPSSTMHEVLPVHCPSRAFQDGRFSIAGWIHKLDAPAVESGA